ncbi:hypothetical protein PHYPO_G00068160 [Pangasianodon hypophthalmus]|uniref:Uncharacterized protein n=2 Tax=Pangasianodon hypophthalmus TaxID=310915 RepID=A0A5N5LTZ3_PANHP|nr:hypothetical protein PHYPO_G00068160 [Pangasianodon hypophthalmus]
MDAQQPGDSADPYTFDAPSHVMDDFSRDSEDNADQWFDLMAAPQNGEMEQLTTPMRVPKPFDGMHNEDLPKAIVSPMVHVTETTASTDSDVPESTAPEPPSNIVTSWGDSRPTGAPSQAQKKNVPAEPRRVLKRPVVKERPQAPSTPPVMKKRRSSTGARQARRSGAATRRSIRQKNKPPMPSAAASTASANQQKSTEQQELERIEALQKEVAEQRKRN